MDLHATEHGLRELEYHRGSLVGIKSAYERNLILFPGDRECPDKILSYEGAIKTLDTAIYLVRQILAEQVVP